MISAGHIAKSFLLLFSKKEDLSFIAFDLP